MKILTCNIRYSGADDGKMDWIFSRGNVTVAGAAILKDSIEGRYPSDHYFVEAQIAIMPWECDRL